MATLYNMEIFFWRIEFQKRGVAHIHFCAHHKPTKLLQKMFKEIVDEMSAAGIQSSDLLPDGSLKNKFTDFTKKFESIYTCENTMESDVIHMKSSPENHPCTKYPSQMTNDEMLSHVTNLQNECLWHTCAPSHKRHNRKSKKDECKLRFNTPCKPLRECLRIRLEKIPNTNQCKGYLDMKRSKNSTWMGEHSKPFLILCGTNSNVQMIVARQKHVWRWQCHCVGR